MAKTRKHLLVEGGNKSECYNIRKAIKAEAWGGGGGVRWRRYLRSLGEGGFNYCVSTLRLCCPTVDKLWCLCSHLYAYDRLQI